jgi:glycosyltransferase involved in cell wall biosynthesis
MIIGIDGNEANTDKRVGIGQYSYNILSYIYAIDDPDVDIQVMLKDTPRKDLPKERRGWKYEVFGPKKLWTQIALPVRLFQKSPRVQTFFTPSHYSPRFAPCKRAISIMDLSYLYFPDLFTKKDLYQLTEWTKYSATKASKIFTISEYSKQSIIKEYEKREDEVIVTYPGYDTDLFKTDGSSDTDIYKKYEIAGPYILFVGTLQPRKNVVRLIEAFQLLTKHHPDVQLVIAGKKGWLYEEIIEKADALGKKIVRIDFVPDKDLPALYRNALCYVLPSLYEGFGIPVVEAMACGTPVVASNITSLPEVVADAGVLVDPTNVQEIANGIRIAAFDEPLRKELRRKGLERVKKFDWKTCAQKTLDELKTIK